jgi:ketosteroid isomerase-like protein
MGNASIKQKQDTGSAAKSGAAALRAVPDAAKPGDIVKSMLDAVVQRGDMDFVRTLIADDCAWCGTLAPELAYGGRLQGPAGAGQFFGRMAETLKITRFDLDRYVCEGEDVAAMGVWGGIMHKTGKSFEANLALCFRVRGGKIIEFRGFEDTALTVAALRG